MRARWVRFLAAAGLVGSLALPGGAAAGAESGAPDCSLVPQGSKTEFASCLRVDASFDRAPGVGETATLSVAVQSQRDLGEVTVEVAVPDGLELVSGPGSNAPAAISPASGDRVVSRIATVNPGVGTETVGFEVRPIKEGVATLEVRATASLGEGIGDGAMDIVPLTVGRNDSQLAVAAESVGATMAAPSAPSAPPADAGRDQAPLPSDLQGIGQTSSPGVNIPGGSCISGTWGYQHPSLGYTGVPNYQIQVWDDDTGSSDDLMAVVVTQFNGTYSGCFTTDDEEGAGTMEVYVHFVSANSVWRVRNNATNDNNLVNTTGVVNVAEGVDFSFGALQPANNFHRGIHAFHAIDKFWQWGHDPVNLCFDYGETPCRQMIANWTETSTDGTYYSLNNNDIHLAAADPDAEHVVIHEATHAAMDDVYNDNYPAFPNCSPHFVNGDSSTGCAWTEGFAEWVPAAVLNDPFFRWPTGQFLDLENVDANSAGWADGDDVEGRVAGAMIDVQDSAVASLDFYDFWLETDSVQYGDFQNYAFTGARPGTYLEYWGDRAVLGHNTANNGANGSNFQNTINYGFVAPGCGGFVVTDFGTVGSDVITGTSGADVIHGLAGGDTIYGLTGNDVVCGSTGEDTVFGAGGADTLYGNESNDSLTGGPGSDYLNGSSGADTLNGAVGSDTANGGDGNDTVKGAAGNDSLAGGGGADTVSGGKGNDGLAGGSGSPDACNGGAGTDTNKGGCESTNSIP
jgi:Ca2+-binding RTX toxin-like protein